MDVNATGNLKCGNCQQSGTLVGIQKLLDHYRLRHGPLNHYVCGQGACRKSFLNLTSMIRHIKSYHKDLFGNDQESSAGPSGVSSFYSDNSHVTPASNFSEENLSPPSDESSLSQDTSEHNILTVCVEDEEVVTHGLSLQDDLQRAAVSVLLGLRSTSSLTGKAIERFQSGSTQMVRQLCAGVKANISSKLLAKGLSAADVQEVLSDIDSIRDPFENLKSIDDQLDYFEQEFGLVKPVEKLLDTRIDSRLDPANNCYVPTQVKETFQYVSIIKTLTALFKNKTFRDRIHKSQASTDGVLRSYSDGTHCKEHPFIQKYEGVVQILLFYDELEIANSLGSKTIIHKLAAFFFLILNLPPEVSSQLSNIFLLALAHADDLKKKQAMEKVLTPLVHEMRRLSSDAGVRLEVDGEIFILRAVLVALTADTPAAHDVLGFLGVGATHFCRACLVGRPEVRRNANAVGERRYPEEHERHILEVLRRPKFSSNCGVKRNCPLSDVPYFHPTENSVFDAFHDLLEGVVPLVIKLTLRRYVFVDKLFIVPDLNLRLASFSYGIPDSRNKPSPNFTGDMLTTAKGKIKQTGSQMWCLMRALPFIIADWVPDGDAYMKHLFLLQDIMHIIFAFEVRNEDIDRLEVLVHEHNESSMRLFLEQAEEDDDDIEAVEDEVEIEEAGLEEGVIDAVAGLAEAAEGDFKRSRQRKKMSKVYVTNKLHHLKHYGEMIRRFGPAVRLWCAKFEGRLKIFRQHSSVCCNFRNPPMTMAKMFQLSNLQTFFNKGDEFLSFQKGISMKVSDSVHQHHLNQAGLSDTTEIVYTNSATLYGEDYRPGLFISLPSLPGSDRMFSIIVEVIVARKSVFLVLKPWKNHGLCGKYNAFKVSPDTDAQLTLKMVRTLGHCRCIAPWTCHASNDVYLSMRTLLV